MSRSDDVRDLLADELAVRAPMSTLPPSPFKNAQNVSPARLSSAVERLSSSGLALGDDGLEGRRVVMASATGLARRQRRSGSCAGPHQ